MFSAVGSGGYHSCGIRASDNGVECWGIDVGDSRGAVARQRALVAIASAPRDADLAILLLKRFRSSPTGGQGLHLREGYRFRLSLLQLRLGQRDESLDTLETLRGSRDPLLGRPHLALLMARHFVSDAVPTQTELDRVLAALLQRGARVETIVEAIWRLYLSAAADGRALIEERVAQLRNKLEGSAAAVADLGLAIAYFRARDDRAWSALETAIASIAAEGSPDRAICSELFVACQRLEAPHRAPELFERACRVLLCFDRRGAETILLPLDAAGRSILARVWARLPASHASAAARNGQLDLWSELLEAAGSRREINRLARLTANALTRAGERRIAFEIASSLGLWTPEEAG